MARVRAGIIIGLVTTRTGAWRIGIIAVVTSLAIVGNRNMRPGERINGTVVKRGRNPGAFAMATYAVRRELGGSMVGVGSRIVIAEVATDASVWSIDVIAVVAGVAVVGNRNVRPVERIECTVVKRGRRPVAFRVAIRTSGRELRGEVVRIGSSIVVRLMAPRTGIGCIVVIAVVASRTVVGNRNMRPVQSIVVVVNRESRRIPAGVRRMAHRTIRGQP